MMSALNLPTNNNDQKKLFLIKHTLVCYSEPIPLLLQLLLGSHLYTRTDTADREVASRWGLRLRKFHFLLQPQGGANCHEVH